MEKIIGLRNYRGYKLVKASADIDDMLRLNISISMEPTNSTNYIEKIFNKFNKIVWDVKVERLFPNSLELEGDNLRTYLKTSLENHFREVLEEKDLPFQDINLEDVDLSKYQSSSLKVIEQLTFFNNMPVPVKTKSFIQEYVDKIEEIELTKSQLRGIYAQFAEPIEEIQEYVMYIGPNDKYRGIVGKIVELRDDIAPNLVEFSNFKKDGSSAKFWSKEENLVRFFI